LIEQGLTSYQTHYKSYQGRFLLVIWPNQQCQSTEGDRQTQLKLYTKNGMQTYKVFHT